MSGNQIGGQARLTGLTVQADRIFGGVHHHASAVPLPIPRQLPPCARHFTDREEDRRALDDARDAGTRLHVISGIGGVGKSALAVRWLSEGAYAGGQLHVDLSGPEYPIRSEAVLRRWLRAFGIDRPPAQLGELTGLWRSVTATRSVAVLIDGATDAGQVRALLPAGEGSSTVVTSRNALRELAIDGAVSHPLRPLTQQAAIQLLVSLAGQDRIEAAPLDAARLADRCFRLPLPLVLVGARLASRPQHSVAAITDALAHSGLPDDTYREDPARMITNTALDGAYQELEEEAQRIYRGLGLLPTGDVDPDLTAAVCELPWARAEWELEVLAEEQLLEPLPERGGRARYRLIPAARDHARRLALQHDPEEERVGRLRRLCEWMLAISTQAQMRLTPAQATLWRSTMTELPPVRTPFDDDGGALAWLESHEGSLLEVLRAAEAAGWDDLVWPLVDTFWPLFLRRHPYELWAAAHEIGLAAARRVGNAAAVRQMLLSGAIGLNAAGRAKDAIRWYGEACDAARDAGDLRDEGQALLGLGSCHHDAGMPEQARPFLTRAIALWRSCGYPRGVALANIVLGEIDLADAPGRAVDVFTEARADLLEVDDPYDAARALTLQGHARVLTGDAETGIREMTTGLAALADAGGTRWQARALEWLGDAHRSKGDAAAAREYYQQAEQLYEVMRPADAERIRGLAAGL
ncbi:tetratricopeptide repeat protein [Streptomyces sp. SAI-090]|uniref:tetratricopeptide repeat protein n=1 Tax=Streptomyces sp. SAI-090 TaxID=2940545 RepID=UPI002474EC0E|nr:tetratricopeptide repeat protein [Streptomyces sp. SAI-090]MDH6522356.1 tetratricopeptide (TPR) repeat protein [Streptomyces sp. SAI-090]